MVTVAEEVRIVGLREGDRPRLFSKRFVLCALICSAASAFIAVVPHLAAWFVHGTPEFLASGDDVIYLAASRAPYYQSAWTLRDPFLPSWQPLPTLFSQALFVPFAKLDAALGLPLILTPILWRLVGGALLGGSLFIFFARLLRGGSTVVPTLLALLLTIICVSDAGFLSGRLLIENFQIDRLWLRHLTPLPKADALGVFRVTNPLLELPFLILLATELLPGRRTAWGMVRTGCWLAICVCTYFYFWTAATMVMGLWAFAALILSIKRRSALREVGFIAGAMALGLVLASPQLIQQGSISKNAQYEQSLSRMSRGEHLPPHHPMRSANLRNIPVWIGLLIGAILVTRRRYQALVIPVLFILSGYCLKNIGWVTGLEFENWHWSMVHTTFLAIMLWGALGLFLVQPKLSGRLRAISLTLTCAAILLLAHASSYRAYESLHAPEPIELGQTLRALAPLREALAKLDDADVLAGPPASAVALLSTRSGLLCHYPHTSHSSLVGDDEVIERQTLNAYLRGMNLNTYLESIRKTPFAVPGDYRPTWQLPFLEQRRSDLYREIETHGPMRLMDRYRPTYLLLPRGSVPPASTGEWSTAGNTNSWELWKRSPQS